VKKLFGKINLVFLSSVLLLLYPFAFQDALANEAFTQLVISPDGQKTVSSDSMGRGLYISFLKNRETWIVSQEIGAAYGATWSTDSRYVAFKNLYRTTNDQFFQAPCLFDVRDAKIIQLHAPVYRCGVPSMSIDGKVAFTVGRTLYITNIFGDILNKFDLPAYANLTPISPDGQFVIYNDAEDRLWILNLQNETKRQLTRTEKGFFQPIWSPGSSQFVASTLDGILIIYNLQSNQLKEIGEGQHPVWTPDGGHIVFSRTEFLENRQVLNIDLFTADANGNNLHKITDTDAWEDYPALSGRSNLLYYSDVKNGVVKRAILQVRGKTLSLAASEEIALPTEPSKSFPQKVPSGIELPVPVEGEYFNIPYIHQKYDTPSWFNGGWACGGTAAVMCISYYGILKPWPAGNSSYGRYVCDIYTYNGYTYDIPGLDPNGNEGYGAYGFIIQDNWRDTKGYMAQYARQHGLASGVDWSPSRSKLQNEVHAKMPFVLLTSLTSAGHYISVIGYENEATTIIVNDPWGDKNRGYPNYYGRRAKYDWPGYSNGHSSIEKAWCFIYFRGNQPDLMVDAAQSPDTVTINQLVSFSGRIINRGLKASDVSRARILFSENSRFDNSDLLLAELDIPALAVQDTFQFEASATIPDSLLSAKYAIGVIADADSHLVELNEANNVGYHVVIVRGYAKIFGVKPAEEELVTETKPHIFAYFTDRYANIDTSQVHLFVDDADVTEQAQIRWNSISYLPEQPLAIGQHSVLLKVGNKAGFIATKEWSFRIETSTDIMDAITTNPETFHLSQNYPNPFNGTTTIAFSLPEELYVTLDIYSVTGAHVKNIFTGELKAGQHLVRWDGTNENNELVSSGIYYYQLKTNSLQLQKRLLLLK